MSELKEYIVTLHRHEDLAGFYEDMETPGGDLYIPDRKVEICARRETSRNTHYMLSEDEAMILREDPRVWDVEYFDQFEKRNFQPFRDITSTQWSKIWETHTEGDINWALLRCTEGTNRSNWGSDGTTTVSGTAVLTSTGKNVDVVILDGGHGDPDSPEFKENSDGSGASRYVQYNWFQHAYDATGGAKDNQTYIYPSGASGGSSGDTFADATALNHNHAYHVTGIACGNTLGWAKDANIYGFDTGAIFDDFSYAQAYIFDFMKHFHINKQINPITGIKNPTIVNCSFGDFDYVPVASITSINYRGTTYDAATYGSDAGKFTKSDLEKYGVVRFQGTTTANILRVSASLSADILDCINAGVIFVGASGNDYYKIDVSTGIDYNNYVTWNGINYYYHRGSFGAAHNCICVSNVANQVSQERAHRIQTGPRIDVFAPGVAIMSTVHTELYYYDGVTPPDGFVTYGTANDSRPNGKKLAKWSFTGEGATSMSTPQVTGVLACLLEHYPRMNQQDCKDWIVNNATLNQIGGITADAADPIYTTPGDPNVNWLDDESLYGAENRYLYYKKQRETQGYVTAQLTNNVRKTSGMMFPRRRHI